MSLKVLIIDDEKPFADMLVTLLGRAGYEVSAVYDAQDGLARLTADPHELVLCDVKMPRMNGLEFLDAAKEAGLGATIIMMSAFGTIDLAIEALRRGAYDYVSKPFKSDEVILTLRKAEEREQLRARVQDLEGQVARLAAIEAGPRPIVGESEGIARLKALIAKVAAYDATVLITGESGTGKELVAQAIHRASNRAKGPFLAVNCGAIPETLLESELFGHVRGAFTDAHQDKPGLFVEASGGTLLLDEVGELPLSLQVSLLRVIQEGEVRPVGAARPRKVDVRLLAATHRNLHEAVAEKRFREDLFYRLNVIPIEVPPLRERVSDLPLLADFILERIAARMGAPKAVLAPDAREVLAGYPWPGNVRELENVLERAVILSDGPTLTAEDLPPHMRQAQSPVQVTLASGDLSVKRAMTFVERELIKRALEQTGGNRTHAAKLLDLSHRALLYKIKDYGLQDVAKKR